MAARHLRVLTYNVHGCVGGDRKHDPARIAEVIEACEADIVGLQELDVGRERSGGIDQAQFIASHLRMNAMFHPAVHRAEEKYGDAILTALPMKTIKAGELPGSGEPRGAIWTEIEYEGRTINVFNTHLGVRRRERMSQVDSLLGEGWLGNPACRGRDCILIGDFNSIPSSMVYRKIAKRMRLAVPGAGGSIIGRPTFPARYPFLRLDHVFISGDLASVSSEVVVSRPSRVASDHLPLVATIALA